MKIEQDYAKAKNKSKSDNVDKPENNFIKTKVLGLNNVKKGEEPRNNLLANYLFLPFFFSLKKMIQTILSYLEASLANVIVSRSIKMNISEKIKLRSRIFTKFFV